MFKEIPHFKGLYLFTCNVYINPVVESCLIVNCFWTVFALICTLIISNTVTPLLTYCTFCQQDVDLDYVAKVTHGFSGADLTEICQRVR